MRTVSLKIFRGLLKFFISKLLKLEFNFSLSEPLAANSNWSIVSIVSQIDMVFWCFIYEGVFTSAAGVAKCNFHLFGSVQTIKDEGWFENQKIN